MCLSCENSNIIYRYPTTQYISDKHWVLWQELSWRQTIPLTLLSHSSILTRVHQKGPATEIIIRNANLTDISTLQFWPRWTWLPPRPRGLKLLVQGHTAVFHTSRCGVISSIFNLSTGFLTTWFLIRKGLGRSQLGSNESRGAMDMLEQEQDSWWTRGRTLF